MASRQEGRGLGVAGMPAVLLPRGSLCWKFFGLGPRECPGG